MKLRTKILVVMICILLLFGVVNIFQVREETSKAILTEFMMRGTSITRQTAVESENHILTENIVALQHTIENTINTEPEVVYIFIVAQDGKILSHTFKNEFPVDLLKANAIKQDNTGNIAVLNTAEGVIYDFAYPILEGKLGTVRVGISTKHISEIIDKSILRETTLIALFLVLGIISSFILANLITEPLIKLRNATMEIARGNLDAKIDVNSKDEIGELASSFNKMAEDLQQTTVSKNYVDNIIGSMFEMLIVTTPDGTIQRVNRAVLDVLGYTEEELVGQPVNKIFEDESLKISDNLLEKGASGVEKTYRSKDGRMIYMLFSGSVMHNREGNVQGMVYVAKDITERKQMEEKLVFISKAKSEFLANMSHELRTPLNSVIGFSELLKLNSVGELNQKQQHYVDNVLTSSKFLLNLINDILDLSKVEAGKIELVIEQISVPEIINETLTLIKEKATTHHVVLKKELDEDLPVILADRMRFKQVLFNLLSNAMKFSKPEGGKVTISVMKDGEMIRVSVLDTGIGIKEEDMDKLFHPFEQLDPSVTEKYGGTGLGLSITKKLVELHGGKIWAESRYGEGTTFFFTLPLVAKKKGLTDRAKYKKRSGINMYGPDRS